MAETYHPPRHILEVLAKIDFEEALGPDDPRYVQTQRARGSERTLDRLARKFGLLLADGQFYPPLQKHVLFFGHTGSGKSTELKHYAATISGPSRFFVAEVDISADLDRNNLQYADTLMAMARTLLKRIGDEDVSLGAGALAPLERWFSEKVRTEERAQEFAARVDAGTEAKGGIPFLLSLFATFTASFKTNATYKEQMRMVVRNTFSDFATAFNTFLRECESALDRQGRGKRVLFVIDGTDKLRREDTRRFFVEDAELLLAIDAHVIYTAPLALKYEGNLTGKLDADLVLPMIKLQERDGTPFPDGEGAMREILLRRADRSLFASDAEVGRLVALSGGHPRELLRLLRLCCELTESAGIDAVIVEAAAHKLASEFRRFLEPEDYDLLARLDRDTVHAGNDERTRRLLYNLALLEYNDGTWRRTHPVVRLLEGYGLAKARLGAGAEPF